jgi:hypothetical protein
MLFKSAVLALACLQGLVSAQLPPYEGENGVGYITIEVPVPRQNIAPNRLTSNSRAAFAVSVSKRQDGRVVVDGTSI